MHFYEPFYVFNVSPIKLEVGRQLHLIFIEIIVYYYRQLYHSVDNFTMLCSTITKKNITITTQHIEKKITVFVARCRLSQVRNHVAAFAFKIGSAFRLDISNPACAT